MAEISADSLSLLRVGELAKRTGKTVRAIHLYEELGLLAPAVRSKGGFRLYSGKAVTRIDWTTEELTTLDTEMVIKVDQEGNTAHEDVYVAIRNAFRLLRECYQERNRTDPLRAGSPDRFASANGWTASSRNAA